MVKVVLMSDRIKFYECDKAYITVIINRHVCYQQTGMSDFTEWSRNAHEM